MSVVAEPLAERAGVYNAGAPPAPSRAVWAADRAIARGLTRRWVWREAPATASAATGSSLADRVLHARGLIGDAAPAFLEPTLKHLHDPSLMPGLDRAAERILAAARAGEAIIVYGDYDADGITATAILVHMLRHIAPGCRVGTYVPHRLDEGYGLNSVAIRELAASGARVIVTVDCGVTAAEPARAAKAAGVDLIITDHHNPPTDPAQWPDAYAVVHPRVPGSAYPFADLCGAGVAYKLAWRLATLARGAARVDEGTRGLLIELLAFAALGSIADVVPLAGENRVIASFGLGRIKHSPLVGLRALVSASGLDGEKVDAWDVAFKLAPRLNACGRMAHAGAAVELFTTNDAGRAAAIARDLTARNAERQAVERAIFESAAARVERDGLAADDRRALVLADAEWHAGVVGIVCSRLVERFGRPTILLRDEGGECHGSGRSIDGFNLHAGLEAAADLLTRFGGHDMAVGLRLPSDKLAEFTERFTAHANQHLTPDDLVPVLAVDARASGHELTLDAAKRLERLAPFGRGNPAVSVLLEDLVLDTPPTPLGKSGDHLALLLRDAGEAAGRGGRTLRVIGWKWGERRAHLRAGSRFDAVVRPNISRWNGRESVEPELLDLRPR